VAGAPLRGRRRPAVGSLHGGCGVWVDLNRLGGRRRGPGALNLNEVTHSARLVGALRGILPVAHGERMRYGYVEIQFKNKRTCVRHKHLSTLVASASQPIQTLEFQVRVLEPKFFILFLKLTF
jgi:hypothetical protein